MTRVLVIGGGGREHAIAWKLSQSPRVQQIFVVPGNGGTNLLPKTKNIDLRLLPPFDDIVKFSKENEINLAIIGPEQPLVDGITDIFRKCGISCFGPSSKAAIIESSKAFSKDFMMRHNIPTAKYRTFSKYEDAVQFVRSIDYPVVLKASGLAAGKGVIVPDTLESTLEGLKLLLHDRAFGAACDEVVIEELLRGQEVSILAFTDGYTVRLMPAAQDHKRIGDGDCGANTGGMGAYAPTPLLINEGILEQIKTRVLQAAVDGLRREGRPYVGVIYAGLMLTEDGIKTLEFNCRLGDPETQVLLPLLETDLLDVVEACVEGRLDSIDIKWKDEFTAVTVVMASKGYPNAYEKGKEIIGLDTLDTGALIFHAGTSYNNGKTVTSGGRVLAVTAVTPTLKESIDKAYQYADKISFEGAHYRRDIAQKALSHRVEKSITYKEAGVDIESGDLLVETIKPFTKSTARPGNDGSLGGFGGLFDLKAVNYKDPILVSGTDGVGTKLLIAEATNIHDTIGIDLVAMSVNDILVQGAEPLFFLDYYATGKLDVKTAAKVIQGIAQGCRDSECSLIGGETAEMPGMYPEGKYDLAGFAVGIVEREKMLPKPLIPGDVILGLGSSGVHSNGYSLVRRLVKKSGLEYNSPAPFERGVTLAEALLRPTRIYVKSLLPLLSGSRIKALAHITGSGITGNLPRIFGDNVAAEIDLSAWSLPPVFAWMAEVGNLTKEELLKTFNCGIGMAVVVGPQEVAEVTKKLKSSGEEVFCIGKVIENQGQQIVFFNEWK